MVTRLSQALQDSCGAESIGRRRAKLPLLGECRNNQSRLTEPLLTTLVVKGNDRSA